MFDLTQVENEIIVPRASELLITNPIFNNGTLKGIEAETNRKVIISHVKKSPKQELVYNEWKAIFDAKQEIAQVLYRHRIQKSLGEFYIPAIQAFQKL